MQSIAFYFAKKRNNSKSMYLETELKLFHYIKQLRYRSVGHRFRIINM